MQDPGEMAERLLARDRSALSRLISWAENADARYPAVLSRIYSKVGKAWRMGITGPPGAGKSTLTNVLIQELRKRSERVGVLAIDPSSPFSGGALLGDRIRMDERTADNEVFIRSMASRDSHGGLARAASDACDVMDAYGFHSIVMETVGVGQSEYDVVAAADSVVVVLCPGAGDEIQAMKSGILEVADVLVVNKSDLPGADLLIADLEDAISMRAFRRNSDASEWKVPVVSCSAAKNQGLDDLVAAIDAHAVWSRENDLDALRRKKRVAQVRRVVSERLEEELWGRMGNTTRAEELLEQSVTPYDVAEEILGSILAPPMQSAQAAAEQPKRGD